MSYISKESLPVLVDKLLDPNNIKIGSNRLPTEIERIATKAEEITKTVYEERDFSEKVLEDGFTKDMVIKGETVQNLSNSKNVLLSHASVVSAGRFKLKHGTNVNHTKVIVLKNELMKLSTKYTIVVDIISNNTGTKLGYSAIQSILPPTGNRDFKNLIGRNIKVVTTLAEPPQKYDYEIYFGFWENGGDLTKEAEFTYMLLEGDWTNKEIPSYFEGIQSVGQNNKINILSQGKNLFNLKTIKGNFSGGSNFGELINYGSFAICEGAVKLKQQTNYSIYLSHDNDYFFEKIAMLDNNKGMSSSRDFCVTDIHSGTSFKTQTNEYLKITIKRKDNIALTDKEIKDMYKLVMLEENVTATSYEPYVCDKKEILLPFEGGLKNIPSIDDGIYFERDEIVQNTNLKKYTHLDSIMPWMGTPHAGYSVFVMNRPDDIKMNDGGNTTSVMCNNFRTGLVGKEGNRIVQFYKNLHFQVDNSELITPDRDGFRKWLETNPIYLCYELATPIVHKVKSADIRLYENGRILVDDPIQPSSAKYSAIIDKNAQIENAVKKTQDLDKRVSKLENFYDNKILENSHKLELLRLDIEGSGI